MTVSQPPLALFAVLVFAFALLEHGLAPFVVAPFVVAAPFVALAAAFAAAAVIPVDILLAVAHVDVKTIHTEYHITPWPCKRWFCFLSVIASIVIQSSHVVAVALDRPRRPHSVLGEVSLAVPVAMALFRHIVTRNQTRLHRRIHHVQTTQTSLVDR